MIVADVMTRDVVAIDPQTSLATAAGWMVSHQISGLPVLDQAGRLVGILSEGDLLHRPELGTCGKPAGWMRGIMRVETLAADYAHTHGRQVGDVMTRNPSFVRPDLKLAKAADLMRQKQVKRLPVLQGETLVGMLCRFDILRALAPLLDEAPQEAADEEIRAAIEQAMALEPWAPRQGISLAVRNGAVRLAGHVGSPQEARALCILAANIGGGVSVEDQLQISRSLMNFAAEPE